MFFSHSALQPNGITAVIPLCPSVGVSFTVGGEEGGSRYRKVTVSIVAPAWRGRAGSDR